MLLVYQLAIPVQHTHERKLVLRRTNARPSRTHRPPQTTLAEKSFANTKWPCFGPSPARLGREIRTVGQSEFGSVPDPEQPPPAPLDVSSNGLRRADASSKRDARCRPPPPPGAAGVLLSGVGVRHRARRDEEGAAGDHSPTLISTVSSPRLTVRVVMP